MAARIDVDWAAVAAVLAAGEIFGDDAPTGGGGPPDFGFDPLQCLPDDSFTGSARDARITCDALVREGIRVAQRAPSGGDVALGLSGGRDSRHLALAARAEGLTIDRYACARHWIPGPSRADVDAARRLAARLGVRLQVVEQGTDRYSAEWRKNSLTALQTLNHSWALPLADALAGPGILLDGLNGGGLFGRDPLTARWVREHGPRRPTPEEAHDHARQHVIAHGRRRVRRWLDSPRIDDRTWREAERRFDARFRRYRDLPNPFQAWWILERARRGTSLLPLSLISSRRTVAPYFTPAMLSFALSLPWEISSDERFQDILLAEEYPDVADIPYAYELARSGDEPEPSDGPPELDHVAEERSWEIVLRALHGHANPAFIAARESPSDTGRGNRRMVLFAQALEWEAGNARPYP